MRGTGLPRKKKRFEKIAKKEKKKMNDIASLFVALMTGVFLGAFFFGGLWWTVRKGLTSDHPALWFFGSTLLRTGVAAAGFYFASTGDWRKLLVCLLGFVIARVVVTRMTKERIYAP
jgi:F1F0 ATPase subunit 2